MVFQDDAQVVWRRLIPTIGQHPARSLRHTSKPAGRAEPEFGNIPPYRLQLPAQGARYRARARPERGAERFQAGGGRSAPGRQYRRSRNAGHPLHHRACMPASGRFAGRRCGIPAPACPVECSRPVTVYRSSLCAAVFGTGPPLYLQGCFHRRAAGRARGIEQVAVGPVFEPEAERVIPIIKYL